MRPDQLERLNALSEKVFDVVIFEANPTNWSGSGVVPKDMTKEQRGDAVWCRKQAAASLALLNGLHRLIDGQYSVGKPDAADVPDSEDEADLDREVASAERHASELLEKLRKSVRA
jgi:hypothetical protein